MREIFVIVKKELKRFFTDKRMIMSLILPGVLIFVLYSLMGRFIGNAIIPADDYEYIICVENESSTLGEYLSALGLKYKKENMTREEAEKKLAAKEIDLYVSFSEGFDDANADKTTDTAEKTTDKTTEKTADTADKAGKNVVLEYNSAKSESAKIYSALQTVYMQNSVASVNYKYAVNAGVEKPDLATEEDVVKTMLTMFAPFILIMFLVTGSIGVATESIAGEKERGTIATLLVTPVKREYIALGKVIALTVTSLFSSLVSFVGLMASLPNLLQLEQIGDVTTIDLSVYGASAFAGMLGIILITVMMFTMLMSILSAFAKSVKEATQFVTPAMMVVMIAGATSMIGGGKAATNPALYLIPVYNCVQCLTMLFSGEFYGLCYLLTALSDALFVVLGIILLAKMFNNEKIMLNK